MDKFTVDLDQVLNDFEYSELTDQYNNATTTRVTSEVGSSSDLPSQSVTKHSINNVFNSLKEYLETNISSLEHIDNNVNSDCTGDYSNPFQKEESIIKESKTDPNKINKTHGRFKEGIEASNEILFEAETFDTVSSKNVDISCTEVEYTENSKEINNDIEIVRYDNTEENHVDLHTELKNVAGSNFCSQYEQNATAKQMGDISEFKTIIGFEQDLHLDDQEINRLLSELEEDDELNIDDANESQFTMTGYDSPKSDDQHFNLQGENFYKIS